MSNGGGCEQLQATIRILTKEENPYCKVCYFKLQATDFGQAYTEIVGLYKFVSVLSLIFVGAAFGKMSQKKLARSTISKLNNSVNFHINAAQKENP